MLPTIQVAKAHQKMRERDEPCPGDAIIVAQFDLLVNESSISNSAYTARTERAFRFDDPNAMFGHGPCGNSRWYAGEES